MYGKNDLRASLAPTQQAKRATPFKASSYARFYDTAPSRIDPAAKTWLARGQNLIVAYSEAEAGAVLAREDQIDEYALLLPDAGLSVEISAGQETKTAHGPCLVFVPPGASSVKVLSRGGFYRLLTTRSADLAALCVNADAYAEPDPNVAPFEPWPDPVGGYRIRVYAGDVPPEPGRFGRLYRGATLMVNMGSGREGPRDPSNLSPHHHDDFEQYSIATAGLFVHHLRWPWTSDKADWREDEHVEIAAPSLAVIPPPAIHTSQGLGAGLNRLADVFCPPRRDFSAKPGWVLNAADYPAPGE